MKTNFIQSKYGFPFENGWKVELFGKEVPMSFGLCGGMCWAALDRFYNGIEIPRTLKKPKSGEPLYTEIFQRQLDTFKDFSWAKVLDWQTRRGYSSRWNLRKSLGHMTKKDWREKIKGLLDAGKALTLCLIRATKTQTPTKNHQVVAYDYNYNDSTKKLTIYIYDPNYPDRFDVAISILFGRPRNRLHAEQTTGENLRAFFLIEYDKHVSTWYVSWGGRTSWEIINAKIAHKDDCLIGDFNGDGISDVFYADGSHWYVSLGGRSNWERLATSRTRAKDLLLGDFNGDGISDVFVANGSTWRVSWGGRTNWEQIATSSERTRDLLLGDFNGDGKTDVFNVN